MNNYNSLLHGPLERTIIDSWMRHECIRNSHSFAYVMPFDPHTWLLIARFDRSFLLECRCLYSQLYRWWGRDAAREASNISEPDEVTCWWSTWSAVFDIFLVDSDVSGVKWSSDERWLTVDAGNEETTADCVWDGTLDRWNESIDDEAKRKDEEGAESHRPSQIHWARVVTSDSDMFTGELTVDCGCDGEDVSSRDFVFVVSWSNDDSASTWLIGVCDCVFLISRHLAPNRQTICEHDFGRERNIDSSVHP